MAPSTAEKMASLQMCGIRKITPLLLKKQVRTHAPAAKFYDINLL